MSFNSKNFVCPAVYDDGDILAISKPSGVLSHPNPSSAQGAPKNKRAFLGEYNFQDRRFDTPAGVVWLIHRLDQDASGLLLAARQAETARKLRGLFEEQKIEKEYVVLLAGRVQPVSGVWRDALGERRETGRVRVSVLKSGRPNAELRYQVKEVFTHGGEPLSLVQIRLITGRTHQIRVQSAYRKCPVAGDDIYGRFALNKRLKKEAGLRRLFLHAFRLAFTHPRTGRSVEITDFLPEDLENVLPKLIRQA